MVDNTNSSAPTHINTTHNNPPSNDHQLPSTAATTPRTPHVGDALSYLEEVKRQFTTQSDVYVRFLDIMKEFKSLDISTTQVISRVSTLFKDHPNLIMGFNTFLPPGFSIQLSNNPQFPVSVLTPDGAIMDCSSDPPAATPPVFPAQPPPDLQPRFSHAPSSAHAAVPPPGTVVDTPAPTTRPFPLPAVADPASSPLPVFLPPVVTSSASHAPQASSTGSTSSANPGIPILSDTISAAASPLAAQGVDFGHAITYVNKLKTHFANQPEVYRQFLEILTNYQRETRPVEEVNERVQHLLKDAPHLIDEFKQFLPLAAAAGRSGGSVSKSGSSSSRNSQRTAPPSSSLGMPVMGDQFPDNRSLKQPSGSPFTPVSVPPANVPNHQAPPTAVKKRKADHTRPASNKKKRETAPVTPAPQNLSGRLVAPCEEMELFDRIKVMINSPVVYGELLKIMNLYAQDALTRDQLIERVEPFLAHRAPDLFAQFKALVGVHGSGVSDQISISVASPHPMLELKPDIAHMDPNLTPVDSTINPVAKLYNHDPLDNPGPSYRHIRKTVPTGTCTGRNALCRSVLNDKYISHPPTHNDANTAETTTDGGTVQRRTVYEENLSRTEEERYEFDINIEANQTCIRLLEPIAQHVQTMREEDRARFCLPKHLGSRHPTILERVLKKLYGENWAQVHDALVRSPAVACSLVLRRLKQKDEEWRRLKREFAKVWRESDAKNFYKALDFQGAALKEGARKFQVKNLLLEIETIYLEVKDKRAMGVFTKQHHMELLVSDQSVLMDVFEFIGRIMDTPTQLHPPGTGHGQFSKLRPFLETLMFCDYQQQQSNKSMADFSNDSMDELQSPSTPGRRRRKHAAKPILAVTFFGNNHLYLVIRLVHAIYQRFHAIKQRGREMVKNPNLLRTISPVAVDLGLQEPPADKAPVKEPAKFYPYMIELLVSVLKGQFDTAKFEEQIRAMFGTSAHHVFSMDRITNVIVKQVKDASSDKQTMELIKLFSPRANAHLSLSQRYHTETHMRLKAEEIMGGDVNGSDHLYRIVVHFPIEKSAAAAQRMLTVQMLTAQDYVNGDEEKWTHYVEQYTSVSANDLSTTAPVPPKATVPFLARTWRCVVRSAEKRAAKCADRMVARDGLRLKICINTYRLYYVAQTEDIFARYHLRPSRPPNACSRRMNVWLDGPTGWNRDAAGDVQVVAQLRTGNVLKWFADGPTLGTL